MSFILDALRKLEEKRAPETTRELLAAGLPGPQGTPRGNPPRPYILTAALAVSILAAAGWLALKYRAGGSEGEPRAVPSSPIAGEVDGTTPPGLFTAGGRTGRKAGFLAQLCLTAGELRSASDSGIWLRHWDGFPR